MTGAAGYGKQLTGSPTVNQQNVLYLGDVARALRVTQREVLNADKHTCALSTAV